MAGDGAWRVLLVDDHLVVRAGLRALLEADPRCVVVGEAGSLAELRAALASTPADLVVLDVAVGPDNALDALPDIVSAPGRPRVVVLTMHDDPELARDALARGADAYVLKEAAAEELSRAVEAVMAGGTYLQPALGARLARGAQAAADALTPREREVLRLLASGHTNAQIAGTLFVSLRTVEAQRQGGKA